MKPTSTVGSSLELLPATLDQWPDVEEFFAKVPCWCQYWRQSAGEYGRTSREELYEHVVPKRKNSLRNRLGGSTPAGILAYLDSELVGWCGIGPRDEMERLVHSRTIPAIDDRPVWSIVCFVVRPGYRRRGVARALLRGAIDCARAFGAPALEAYPVNPGDKRIDPTSAYVGTLSMFQKEGFRPVVETDARSAGLSRWLVRFELGTAPSGGAA